MNGTHRKAGARAVNPRAGVRCAAGLRTGALRALVANQTVLTRRSLGRATQVSQSGTRHTTTVVRQGHAPAARNHTGPHEDDATAPRLAALRGRLRKNDSRFLDRWIDILSFS
jgi:hypothetical protein